MDPQLHPDLFYLPLGAVKPVRKPVEPAPLPSPEEIERLALEMVAGAVRRRAKCPEAEELAANREALEERLATVTHRLSKEPPWAIFRKRRLNVEAGVLRARLSRLDVLEKRAARLNAATEDYLRSGRDNDFEDLKTAIADGLALKRDLALREFFLAKAEEFKTAAYRTGLQADQDPEFARWQRDYNEWMGKYRARALGIDDNSDLIRFGNRFQVRVAGEIADRALAEVLDYRRSATLEINYDCR